MNSQKKITKYLSADKITIFIKNGCPFCTYALDLFRELEIKPNILDISHMPENTKQELITLTNMTTIPQIFIGFHFIGGFTQLKEFAKTKNGKSTLHNFKQIQ
jgi:glutaredoxin